eukprot:TRINITY_DN2000_c0_g1_i4.p1 TRINITY_DN2000_c0_g1~~TRINITY_DN2000_c0_g1_i4.p1  ORF type:complete len:721 (-),score=124.44 TRINITY_DN2000_c0_g1_i4:206-2368(-)
MLHVALLLSCLTHCSSVSHLDLYARARDPPVTIIVNDAREQKKLAESVLGEDEKTGLAVDGEKKDAISESQEIHASDGNAENTGHASDNSEESQASHGKATDTHQASDKANSAHQVSDGSDDKRHASHGNAADAHQESHTSPSNAAGHHGNGHGDVSSSGEKTYGGHGDGGHGDDAHSTGHGDGGHGDDAHSTGHGDGGHGNDPHSTGHEENNHGNSEHGGHGNGDHHGEHGHEENTHGNSEHGGHGNGDHHGEHGHEENTHGNSEHGGHGNHHGEHGHGDHGHDGAEHGEAHGDHSHGGHGHGHSAGAHAVAVGLIATVLLVPLVLWMALEDGLVAQLTLKMLDTFISIFLAVLWFNCFSQALVTFNVASLFPYAEEVFGLVQVLSLYAISMLVAYLWRDEKKKLITFGACAAHCIAFSGISASGITQAHASEDLADGNMEPVASLIFCLVIIGFILLMSEANSMIWRNKVDHGKLNHCIDELELDVMGLVGSFLITQSVRHALIGHYPPLGHFFLQIDGHAGVASHPAHEAWQRMFMLGWAVGLTILSAVLLPRLDKLHGGKMMHKFVHISKVMLIMLVAWGYLLWGQWEFYEVLFHGDLMFGNMVFAVLATLVALAVLYGMANAFGDSLSSEQRETFNMMITGIGLVAAWSWEHCFNLAFNVIGQEYQVGYKGLMPKLFLSIVIPAALLPTYVRHIKTRVIEDEEREHAAAHHASEH